MEEVAAVWAKRKAEVLLLVTSSAIGLLTWMTSRVWSSSRQKSLQLWSLSGAASQAKQALA